MLLEECITNCSLPSSTLPLILTRTSLRFTSSDRSFCQTSLPMVQDGLIKRLSWWKKEFAKILPFGVFTSLWASSITWIATITRQPRRLLRRVPKCQGSLMDEGSGGSNGGEPQRRQHGHRSM